jgi:hypothetical protein
MKNKAKNKKTKLDMKLHATSVLQNCGNSTKFEHRTSNEQHY